MKASGETKLLLVLGLIVVLGVGALVGLKGVNPTDPVPTPPPPIEMNAERFDELARGARHSKGDPTATVEVIEFADFQCPSCRRAFSGELGKNLKDPNRKIRFYFRHFPLEMHEFAEPAALATEAAAKQGKFWAMYDALFVPTELEEWNDQIIVDAAKTAGLDMTQFEQDRKDGALQQLVNQDKEAAVAATISFTPTFLIKTPDGKVKSVVGGDDFGKAMDEIFGGAQASADKTTEPASAPAQAPAPAGQ